MKEVSTFFISVLLTLCVYIPTVMAVKGDIERGRAIYVKHCVICHGSEGKGNGLLPFDPPLRNLASPEVQKKSDFELWTTVHDGTSHSVMKSWKWTLSEQEIVMVLAYVQSLGQ